MHVSISQISKNIFDHFHTKVRLHTELIKRKKVEGQAAIHTEKKILLKYKDITLKDQQVLK